MTQTERDSQARLREQASDEGIHAAVRSRLSDYLDSSLTPTELADIRQHLDSCAACQAYWLTFLRVVTTTGQLPRRSFPQPATERMKARLERAPTRS